MKFEKIYTKKRGHYNLLKIESGFGCHWWVEFSLLIIWIALLSKLLLFYLNLVVVLMKLSHWCHRWSGCTFGQILNCLYRFRLFFYGIQKFINCCYKNNNDGRNLSNACFMMEVNQTQSNCNYFSCCHHKRNDVLLEFFDHAINKNLANKSC